MTRALLNPRAADHLAKICGLFGSCHDGERAAAALKADQYIRRLGLAWSDVIAAPTEWQHMARVCRDHISDLSPREREFVISISKMRRPPSEKQLAWLADIFDRIEPPRPWDPRL